MTYKSIPETFEKEQTEAVGNTFPILLLKCFQISRNLAKSAPKKPAKSAPRNTTKSAPMNLFKSDPINLFKSAPRKLPEVLSGTCQECSHTPAKSALRHLSRVFLGPGVQKIRIHVFKSIFKILIYQS